MTQTLAIFHEAYRNLNSKKLFWIVLSLSALGVAAFACVGVNERGVKLVVWQFDNDALNSHVMPPGLFYKQVFVTVGIGLWLSWLATILALISTAGIFPDLMTSGSVDLYVSKPISRLRLFLTEYAAGLLFVALQVSVFSLASFLVIGLRGGSWEPGLFMAVPLMVCFFSYLFAVCVLVGVLTRSTVAAVLLTLLFWFFVYALGTAESGMLMFKTMHHHGVDMAQPSPRPARDKMAASPAKTNDNKMTVPSAKPAQQPTATRAAGKSEAPGGPDPARGPMNAASAEPADESLPVTVAPTDDSRALDVSYDIVYGVKTVLPKTSDTIALLERVLIDVAELPKHPADPGNIQQQRMQAAGQEMVETVRSRSLGWVLGTSLGFEALVLTWAAFIFCRRNY